MNIRFWDLLIISRRLWLPAFPRALIETYAACTPAIEAIRLSSITGVRVPGTSLVPSSYCASLPLGYGMAGASPGVTRAFDDETRALFLEHLRSHPSSRRLSVGQRALIIEWLTDVPRRPTSQSEFSRRNYVRRAFVWDAATQTLISVGKVDGDNRVAVTQESIVDVVEQTHINNNHLGWDATWRDVSATYYGVLRSDVIFLLKQCLVCKHYPSKQPKTSRNIEQEHASGGAEIPNDENKNTRHEAVYWEIQPHST